MSANFYELLKYAATGIASPDMTYYDRMRASALMGGATVQTLTGIPPLTFKADGSPLISWSMKGNGSQQGTPTPDNPVMPEFVGTLDDSDWTVPISCAGQTVSVYLGLVSTVRRIRKLVLTGEETDWEKTTDSATGYFRLPIGEYGSVITRNTICTHFQNVSITTSTTDVGANVSNSSGINAAMVAIRPNNVALMTIEYFKQFLASEFAAGHPVTVWYAIITPETAIVNEPLCKIGDYADELHSEDAAVTISTVKGSNTLTVDTPIQPSEMTITFKG